jgi:ankyrin repeat protein
MHVPVPYANAEEVLAHVGEVVEFFDIEIGSIDQRGIFGDTPLGVVCTLGDVEAARLLLDAGADIEARQEDQETPLIRAASFGHVDQVRLLAERGASLTARDSDDQTALDRASQFGYAEIVDLLNK